jgi:hypothetical protein
METLLVGLGHKARQGKNVVAEELVRVSEGKAKLYALADELKTYCRDRHEELFAKYPHVGTKHKDDPIYGYVEMLQWVGTDVIRKENPNYWVEVLSKRIEAEQPEIAVVTDVRFPNEAEWIKQREGCLVKVQRITADGTPFIDPTRSATHPSETALDDYNDWHVIIQAGDGEVEALRESARALYALLTGEIEFAEYGIPNKVEQLDEGAGVDGGAPCTDVCACNRS